MKFLLAAFAVALAPVASQLQAQAVPTPTHQSSGTTALLQAISPVTESVVWVSGHAGTWARTLDGGATWEAHVVEGHETLQFRDVDAFDAQQAYLLSAGTGPLSRIFRTRDGGESWEEQYVADHPDAFLDCMAFWDEERGIAYGDAVDGVLFILRTLDGGGSWGRVPARGLLEAQDGEGGFAASGTCVTTGPDGSAWIAAGNAERARLFHTTDFGATWKAIDAPVVGGSGAGLTSVGFVDGGRGYAIGGPIGENDARVEGVAMTTDGGATWVKGGMLAMLGPAYGAAWAPGRPAPTVFAVGPGGVDWSTDKGATWQSLSTTTYWAIGFAPSGVGWSVGPMGRITRWAF